MTPGPFTRRAFIRMAAGAAAAPLLPAVSLAANPTETPLHGLSAFGELKYPPDFAHFEFASPQAPKGGSFVFSPSYWYFNQNTQTFNTLNTFVLAGEAPPRIELCFDSLMNWAWDEPDALYCSLARTVTISADRNRYRFELREAARFHDGSAVTADDVVFSYLTIREQGHPQLALDLANLETAEAAGPHTVELVFNGSQSERAILAVANSVPILSRAWYATRDFEAATLEPALGSGPWKVGRFESGLFIEYERVADYWAGELGFARGLDHFDRIRIDFFRERTAFLEAFKKGDIAWREEFTAKFWATEYDFPAARQGRVKQAYFPSEKRPSLQGWAVNTRRAKFADRRTRQALAVLFDFEWTNRNLFYDAYARSHSLFEGSDLAANGPPPAGELALLEPLRDKLPEAAFGEAVMQNVTDGSGSDRSILRKADALFAEAGWRKRDGRLVDANGEQLSVEVLIRSQVFERILGAYTENMRRMGIAASIRLVDPSQFQARLDRFDFDLAGLAFSFENNPTMESLRQYFHSETAGRSGSRNYPGIADPAVDALIAKAGRARTHEELATVMRALDRVLRVHHFWIPNWHSANHRVAYWDMFGWKDPKPDFFFPVERLWWFDRARAAAIGRA
ncbi:MAG: ABC transporter substrate-binding protein [Alphaproteobacteria bacterium]|nr:MAG: ABC transporter substrate-binding protein [Alphaproteobacteria bacterium]